MWMSFGRPAPRRPAVPSAPSLYRAWTTSPASVLARLSLPGFTLAETAAMERWAEGQRPWGLGLRLRRDATGAAKLAEVFGPDGCAPLAIITHDPDGGFRVDDFSGEVHACASLDEAQGLVLETL
jgi:hypothetical protein